MARLSCISAVLLSMKAALAYDRAYFSTNASEWLCDGMIYGCNPPQICVHDDVLNKGYCCGADSTDAICWGGSTDCGSNNTPLSGQIGCDTGDNAFCCLQTKEQCTQRTNQINICWATAANPFVNVTNARMNATYSSLSSASASATALSVNTAKLLATSTSTPASSSAFTTSSSSSTSSMTSAPPSSSSSSGLSGGAIAGIVVGVIGGLALVSVAAFICLRRRKHSTHGNELDSNPYAQHGYGAVATENPQEKYANNADAQYQYPPVEMGAESAPVEVPGSEPSKTVRQTEH